MSYLNVYLFMQNVSPLAKRIHSMSSSERYEYIITNYSSFEGKEAKNEDML